MPFALGRRAFVAAAFACTVALPAVAQEQKLRFSAVFSDKDIRAQMTQMFADAVGPDFVVEPYYGGNLFKQGTELVALQRGNLEMGNIAPQDIANQVPEFSLLTAAYVFRDAAHMRAFYASDFGQEMVGRAEEQLGVKILGPTYFGARQVGLKPEKEIATPADMSGIKLRMPGGDAWQFLGQALGANPTPMAYAEVYTGLQTGAIDGQDNPLPNVQNMKFYEVMSQIVLTSHLVGYDLLTISRTAWDAMTPEQQEKVQQAANDAIDWSQAEHLKMEAELAKSFEEMGLKVYVPDVAAFREHAQKMYLESDLAKSWPEGMLDKINGLGADSVAAEASGTRRMAKRLYRFAEFVAAMLLAAMFLAFLAQIVFRYALNLPVGWTSEITVVTWLWLVLWGAAFVVKEKEEIRFDLLYGSAGPAKRRVLAILTAAALLVLYGMSFPAVWDYVTFMKVQSTAYLKIRFDLLFSIYVIFVVAVMIRYVWILWRALLGGDPGTGEPAEEPTGP